MVKRLVVMMMVSLLLAGTAVASDGITFWGLTGDGADHLLNARVGITREKVEVGASVAWLTVEPDWRLDDPDAAGPYCFFHINEILQITDPLPDSGFENFLHTMLGRPYAGIETLIPCDGDQRTVKINYVVGTLLSLDEDFDWALVVEWKSGQGIGHEADSIVTVGARILF